jgi:hypothetical protein
MSDHDSPQHGTSPQDFFSQPDDMPSAIDQPKGMPVVVWYANDKMHALV